MLQALGLSPSEEAVYTVLLARPSASVRDVALQSGLGEGERASELGLSIRTVERRVRRLMDLSGVESRLQLGWHAARVGWL
ncbi:hypothetical protein [Streptomyces sp. NBC_00385]|uniref:hypothetical protein n=1 Tax=Streptomyces sp. NBC_00385 TaxID=2975733 RepID=UPI002DDA2C84|nr:hypothetical protein [Streptomyces sp. NBC_00385]WRZ06107.1 hypothetical protein OG959_23590 [Streptomyces sp. NBC_00385]